MASVIIHPLSPTRIFLWSAFFYFLLWLIAPINFVFESTVYTLFFFIILSVVTVLGLFFGEGNLSKNPIRYAVNMVPLKNSYYLLTVLGTLGFVLKFIDRFYLRSGGQLTSNFVDNRELITSAAGSGGISFIANILFSFFLFVPFLYYVAKCSSIKIRWARFLLLMSLSYPLFDLLVQGSRLSLVMYVLFFFISRFLFLPFSLRPSQITVLILIAILFLWVLGFVFAIRTEQLGIDLAYSMGNSGYARFAPASDGVLYYFEKNGIGGIAGILYSLVHLSQYMLHGIYELFHVIENVTWPQTYGGLNFFIPTKVITSLIEFGDYEYWLMSKLLRPGVYTTFYGPLIYDFGLLGAVIMCFIFSFIVGKSARAIKNGNVNSWPLYVLGMCIVPVIFSVSVLVSGNGQYALICGLLILLINKFRYFRITY